MKLPKVRKKRSKTALFDVLMQIKRTEHPTHEDALLLCIELVKAIRPPHKYDKQYAEPQLNGLVNLAKSDETLRKRLKEVISKLVTNTDLTDVMTGCGLTREGNFGGELWRRLKHKILPVLPASKGNFLYIINSIFYKPKDYRWVSAIRTSLWVKFFELIDIEINLADRQIYDQLFAALRTLSIQASALGLEKTITDKLGDDKRTRNSFVEQSLVLISIFESMVALGEYKPNQEQLSKFLRELTRCKAEIRLARRKALTKGAGLRETYNFLRLGWIIERMELIVDIINGDEHLDLTNFVGYFKSVVEYENTKNRLRAHVRQTVELLAYRVAEHEQSTGEHYITSTKKEYKTMFKSASRGGFIISFTAIFKNLLYSLHLAPFWQSFTYSINYALGFIAIQVSGSTLATKQPAMTASTIAKSLTGKRFGNKDMAELAITVSKVMRSQTASFSGNLLVVFPMTFALAALFHFIFGVKIADGEAAQALLDNQNPIRSLSILYACYTGVFLFLSGIISGFFDNKAIYAKIPERIKAHPILRVIVPRKALNKSADYLGRNLGLLAGNLCLGFFLGFTAFFGYIFGIPFDIRHITIAAGNFAIGLYGLGTEAILSDVIWSVVGVFLIGFFNFLVSFFLAFYVAVRSRGIKLRQYPSILKYLSVMIKKYPLDFIRPPKNERKVTDIITIPIEHLDSTDF
ncbi:MAG: site-specific recombinase [Prevotellaceae bacterium]|jgi:site-specific recombinase|nr:site-specific recombinase [Prevotellaceae bacterium]